MTHHPSFKPFNFQRWIDANQHLLKPPVSNKQLFDQQTGMVVMIVGGPNQRVDFHDDPVEEFFYQLKGDMLLKIAEGGKIYDVPVREGEVFLLPAHVRHSPQRPQEGSIGLVVEPARPPEKPHAHPKYWQELLGQAGGPVRRPMLDLTEAEKAQTRAAFEACGLQLP